MTKGCICFYLGSWGRLLGSIFIYLFPRLLDIKLALRTFLLRLLKLFLKKFGALGGVGRRGLTGAVGVIFFLFSFFGSMLVYINF